MPAEQALALAQEGGSGRLPEELLAALRETSERVIRYALVSRPMGWTGEQQLR